MARAMALPFSFDANGYVNFTTDERKMWQDRIVLALMTSLSERVMRPDYGTRIGAKTFENVALVSPMIEQEIVSAFRTWLVPLAYVGTKMYVDDQEVLILEIQYTYGIGGDLDTVIVRTDTFNRSGDIITEVTSGR